MRLANYPVAPLSTTASSAATSAAAASAALAALSPPAAVLLVVRVRRVAHAFVLLVVGLVVVHEQLGLELE